MIYRTRSNPARPSPPSRPAPSRRCGSAGASSRSPLSAFLVPAFALGDLAGPLTWVLDASIPPELQQVIAQKEFADYPLRRRSELQTGQVTVNNAFVASPSLCVAPVLGPVSVPFNNGLNVGVMGAVMHHAGEGPSSGG